MFSMYTPIQSARMTAGVGTFEEFIDSIVINDDFGAEADNRTHQDNGTVGAAPHVGPTNQPSSGNSSGESASQRSTPARENCNVAINEARDADADKMARLRQRNRDAQARHRRRQREQCAGLASRAQSMQQRLAEARDRRHGLRDHYTALTQRVSVAVATLSVTKDVMRTLPLASPPTTKPVQALVPTPPPSVHLQAEPFTIVPRALNSFVHCVPLAIEHIQEVSGSASQTFDMSKRSSRTFIDQYKSQEAVRACCSPSDICWFLQMHFEVATGVPLSLSTTLSTSECIASFALNFAAFGLQMGLFAALDCNVNDDATELFSVLNVSDHIPRVRKRTRDFSVAAEGLPSGYTTAMASAAAVAERDASPAFRCSKRQLTCGVNRRCAVERAVHKVIRDVVATFCGVLSQTMIRRVCLATLEQINAMLGMFRSETGQELPPQQTTHTHVSTDSRFSGTIGSAIHDGLDSEQDAKYLQGMNEGSSAVLSACQNALESLLHNLNAMVAAAQETMARLTCEEQAMAEVAATVALLDTKMRHSALTMSMIDACMFAEAGPIICRMSMLAIQPLLSFHSMESMNVKLYKQLQLSRDQMEHLREFWDAWEHRKRSLDDAMQSARTKLRNLPYGIALPMHFLDRINTLAETGMHSARDGGVLWDAGALAALVGESPPLQGGSWSFDRLRLLGMSPMESETAAKCARQLHLVHRADVEAFIDSKEVQLLPFSALNTRQMVCMWSAHVLHKSAPHDFFGIARLAASQLRRESLYRLQTYE